VSYIVFSQTSTQSVSQWSSIDIAISEAERLAEIYSGHEFFVLKMMGSARVEKPAARFTWAEGVKPDPTVTTLPMPF